MAMARVTEVQGNDSVKYWDTYLSGLESCHFPSLYSGASQLPSKRPLSVRIDLQHLPVLQDLSNNGHARLVTSLQIAWALVLRCYTGLDNVCFGLLEIGNAVGDIELAQSFMQLPVAKIDLDESKALTEILEHIEAEYHGGRVFRRCLPETISRRIHTRGSPCFNTAILLRTEAKPVISDSTTLTQKQPQFGTLEEVRPAV